MPSTSSGSLILPVVLWDNSPPECQISSILVNETEKFIFTGTTSGHILMWDFSIEEITPVCLMIGHTSVVNCLAKAGATKDEEYIVSSSENGEMKLWEMNEKKCIENIKMSNTVHKHIYSSKLGGKYTRLFCIGNYTDVLVIDPISLDILYTLVSREQHQWIKALCINSLANKQDDVIVGVSITGIIKLWTLNANETKGSEIVEHEFKNSLCENASTLASCPGKQRIFIIVCPKFFQIFDAVDFTVLCQVNVNSLTKNDSILFTNGFFIDIHNVIVSTSDGQAYMYSLPENINPQSAVFRKSSGIVGDDKYFKAKLLYKFNSNDSHEKKFPEKIPVKHFYCSPIFYLYEVRKRVTTQPAQQNPTQPTNPLRYLIRGDSNGRLCLWDLNKNTNELIPRLCDYEMSLRKFWAENFKQEHEYFGSISTLLYLQTIDKIVYGLNDGSIVIVSAIDFLVRSLFRRRVNKATNIVKLKHHTAKITCILYPHAEHSRYDPTMLVTGSLDFSIVLWNINTGEKIHKFVIQTGEILQLSVPPNNVNPRILQCICSISSDHSVALLSLKECKPVMLANRHLFPVLFVKWRPLDDFLIVKCSDGSVFVWQIETGSLERVAHGLQADDILNAADEIVNNPESFSLQSNPSSNLFIPPQTAATIANQTLNNSLAHVSYTTPMILSNKSISNQTIALAHILQKRNFSHAIKVISQKLASTKEDSKKTQPVIDSTAINFPLVIQPFHLSPSDPVKHLLLFDIDALLTTLILEEYAIDGTVKQIKNSFYRDIHNIQSAPVQVISPLYRTTPEISANVLKRNASAKQFDSIDIKQLNNLKSKVNYAQSIIKLTNILLSSLHIWSIDSSLDKTFTNTLDLQKPKYPISFGRISRGAHLFIMFPPKRASFTFDRSIPMMNTYSVNNINKYSINEVVDGTTQIPTSKSFNLSYDESDEELARIKSSETVESSSSGFRLPRDSSVRPLLEHFDTPSPTREYWLSIKTITTEHLLAILAISNSFMSLHNFIDLQVKKDEIDPIQFILGQNNLNNSDSQSIIKQTYSRMTTMYCMLTDYYGNDNTELNLRPLNLETLALKWMDPSYEIREAAQALLKNELKRMGPNGRASLIKIWEPHLTSFLKDFDEFNQTNLTNQTQSQQTTQLSQSTSSLSSVEHSFKLSPSNYELSHLPPTSNRIRRKQFVAIIILSLIGAEFGQDVNSNKNQAPFKTIPQGFSLEDHSILKRISNALSNLVVNKSLQYDITRRAAIDLIGRGFTVWEPFIQPTHIILALLELAADAELYSPRLTINLPLTSLADLCKIARHSLTIIANSKPKTFILTVAKEIKRVNTSSSQISQNSSVSFNSALTRGKPEILSLIERLIENQCQDVFELLSDVIEIILFCIDPNQVRQQGLEETFPSIFKFPMVRYCKETKRIICGCHNGRLVVYEFKASKWNFQSYPAHNGQPIVAVAISSDSKYVASYSAHDNSLIFWQSSGGTIFNIGSNTIKQIKVCNAAPVDLTVPYTKLANLFWQNRTLNLVYHDNRKFSYQI